MRRILKVVQGEHLVPEKIRTVDLRNRLVHRPPKPEGKFLRWVLFKSRQHAIRRPAEFLIPSRQPHGRAAEGGDPYHGMKCSRSVANQDHDAPAGNALIRVRPGVTEVPPYVDQ